MTRQNITKYIYNGICIYSFLREIKSLIVMTNNRKGSLFFKLGSQGAAGRSRKIARLYIVIPMENNWGSSFSSLSGAAIEVCLLVGTHVIQPILKIKMSRKSSSKISFLNLINNLLAAGFVREESRVWSVYFGAGGYGHHTGHNGQQDQGQLLNHLIFKNVV